MSKDGHLYDLYPFMGIFVPLPISNIKDFIMIENNGGEIELLTLIEEPNKKLHLKIFEYPGLLFSFIILHVIHSLYFYIFFTFFFRRYGMQIFIARF